MEYNLLEECILCPHKCKVNRNEGQLGRCKSGKNVKLALANLHFFEEPCISGEEGSGTIFFSGCNMSCKFCQNYKISQNGMASMSRKVPADISEELFTDSFLPFPYNRASHTSYCSFPDV